MWATRIAQLGVTLFAQKLVSVVMVARVAVIRAFRSGLFEVVFV